MSTDNEDLKRQLRAIIANSVHPISPVEYEPVTVMTRWRLMQVVLEDGTRSRHLVGWADREGRASSAIQQLDVRKLVGITRSGRRYELRGESYADSDADWVFGRWCHINRVVTFKDVSRALLRLRARLGPGEQESGSTQGSAQSGESDQGAGEAPSEESS